MRLRTYCLGMLVVVHVATPTDERVGRLALRSFIIEHGMNNAMFVAPGQARQAPPAHAASPVSAVPSSASYEL